MEHTTKQDPYGSHSGYSDQRKPQQQRPPQQQQQQYNTDYSRYRTAPRPSDGQGGSPTRRQHTPRTAFIGSVAALEHILAEDNSNRGDYEQRTQYAQQLDKFILDSCNSGVIQWHRQDMMQIVEMCTYYSEQSLSHLLSTLDVPVEMKESLSRILATAACHTRLDLLMGWLLDRLNRPPDTTTIDATSNEYKYWLLSILQETIVRAQMDTFTQRQLQECAPSIMTHLMLFLDTTEAIQQLEIVLMILSSLSHYYSSAFVTHFQSLVDLLVGWCLNAETSDQHCDIIHNGLVSFGCYWNTNIVFGFELLQHFINDLYTQIQEIQALEDSEASIDNLEVEHEKSCQRLLRCFYCLSQAVIPLIPSLDQYHQINALFYQLRSDTIMLFLQALDVKCLTNESWFYQCNQIMVLISSIHPITFQQLQHSMYYYFTTQFERSFMTPLIYIGYLLKMIDNSKPAPLSQEMVHKLLDINQSPLFSLFESQQEKIIQQGILLIFYHIFSTCPTSVLKTYIIQWGTSIQSTIISTTIVDNKMPMISQIITTKDNDNIEKIHLDPITYCQLLLKTAMAVKKNGSNDDDVNIIQYQHDYQTVKILYELWRYGIYDTFDTILILLIDYWFKNTNNNIMSTQIALLNDLTLPINWEILSIQSKLAILDYIQQHHMSMEHLIEAEIFEINPSIKEKIIRLSISHSLIVPYFHSRMTSSHSIVRNAAKDSIQAMNPFTMINISPTLYWEKNSLMPLLKAMIMSTPHTGDFRPIHYELVMKKLGMQHLLLGNSGNIDPSDQHINWDWAQRLFYSCGGTHSLENTDLYQQQNLNQRKLVTLLNESSSLLYYWALWECSRYCILSRLRTPFGTPQQTFATFEKSLVALVNDDTTITNEKKTTQLYGLLTLLDRLEIQIYNAAEGNTNTTPNGPTKSSNTPTIMPMVPKGNFTFFHTNRKTCQEYYLRIRPLLIQGAKKLNWDTFFLKHAMMLLSSDHQLTFSSIDNLMAFFKKINPYVKDIVDTCIRNNMVDTITGLEKWYEKMVNKGQKDVPSFKKEWYFNGWIGPLLSTTPINMTWISWFQIANDFAMGYDENAIASMSQFESIEINNTEESEYIQPILDMLNKHALHFYTSLEDYDSIRLVCQHYPHMFNIQISKQLVDFTGATSPPTIDLTAFLPLNEENWEPLVQLGRLTTFRRAVLDNENNTIMSQRICQRLLPCLVTDDQPLDSLIFANHRSNLIEIQLQHRLFMENNSPSMIIPESPLQHYPYHDTKTWARLSISSNINDMITDQMRPALYLKTAQVAKQQLNYRTASTYLDQFFSITKDNHHSMTLHHQAMYEKIKLELAIDGDNTTSWKDAFLAFNSMLLSMNNDDDDQRQLKTKIFLNMARLFEENGNDETANILMSDPNLSSWLTKDSIVSTLINKATDCTIDTYAKPWFIYGEHYFQQGYQLLEEINQFMQKTSSAVSPNIRHVQSIWNNILSHQTDISQDQYPEYEKLLWHIFKIYFMVMTCNESNNDQIIDILLEKLQQHTILAALPQNTQVDLLTPLLTIHAALLTYFRTAISAFFRYLDLSDTTTHSSMLIRATLYLVKILVQYGDALKPEFENEIDRVWSPTQLLAWKQIMPQLFSRLVHHSSIFVKKILGHWIGQLVNTSPHQVIYHVIVGITGGGEKETQQVLQNQVDRIKQQSEHIWTNTRRMTEELERITVLWEETWIHRISTLQFDVMNQWEQMDKSLHSMDIYKTLMQHVIYSLNELMSITINGPNIMTPHEKWFDTTFGKSIRRAYELVETPESLDTYRKGWDKFQQIHRQLTIETQKCRIFDLKDVSPYLANLQDETSIRMPGLDPLSSVHIHHFGPTLTILPTKTKPKKMDLHGTDGNTYTYLFKGLEDLQLDERIMQLLGTTNILLREDSEASKRHLQARTYSVIPMSAHSGMIQWVEQATPLFSFYKNWQKRSYLNTMMLQPTQVTPQKQQRPTEHYTEKVLQKMKVAGFRVTTNRRHWPTDILCAVYQELADETPQDLLSKAIWWSSTDSQDYLNKRSRLARTMAVMSMIGYVIGLGDRHLDNMLMDDTTGDIVHIDYNVCFEKGTTLRVPERVPYRLTRNMVHALGLLNGHFGMAAEHTLRILRQHKALLLGLMEDALVMAEPLLIDEKMVTVTNVETSYGLMMGAAAKEEQQHLDLQESLVTMAEKLAKTSTVREKQHELLTNDLSLAKQRLQQLEDRHQLEENDVDDTYDDEQDEDEEDDDDEDDPIYPISPNNKPSPPSDWEHEHHSGPSNTNLRAHVPFSVQVELGTQLDHILQQLHQPYDTSSSLTIHDMLPLLDSIRMMDMAENNEIHAAQQSAKIILDMLRWLDTWITKLDDKNSFTFSKLTEMVQETMDYLDQYYTSLRMLESFGGLEQQQQSKLVTTTSVIPRKQGYAHNNNATRTGVMKRVQQKLEGKDQDYVSSVDEIMTVAEQVSKTIQQATSVQNLSLMYEGWTSWV